MAKIEKGNGVTFFTIKKEDLLKNSDAYGVVEDNQEMETFVEKSKIKERKKWSQWVADLAEFGVVPDQAIIDSYEGYGD